LSKSSKCSLWITNAIFKISIIKCFNIPHRSSLYCQPNDTGIYKEMVKTKTFTSLKKPTLPEPWMILYRVNLTIKE
jgi:hypothetical protein